MRVRPQMSAATSTHRAVLAAEAVDALAVRPDGVYVDGTFGRGGHSRPILARLGPRGRLIALDRDPQAVAAAREIRDARFSIMHVAFSGLAQALDAQGAAHAQGMLFDLGVSSPQIDDPARGFSFRADGPLDMRMDPTQGQSRPNGWPQRAKRNSGRSSGGMGKNGLLNRLQRRLLLLAGTRPSARPANLPISWLRRSAHGSRARIRRRAPFKLYGFSSIGSLRKCR